MDAQIQSHRTITNAGNSGFFVRYSIGREVLEEIPYGEGYSYGNRGVNSQRVHSYNNRVILVTIFLFQNSQISPIQIMSVHAKKLGISTQNLDFPSKKNICQMTLIARFPL